MPFERFGVLTLSRAFASTPIVAMLSHTPVDGEPLLSQIRKYIPRYQSWPYDAKDFSRFDERSDSSFYDQPRYVAHIDDAAITRLTRYFGTVVPRHGRILDFCTSWNSWYPDEYLTSVQNKELEVYGIGMNRPELERNRLFEDFPERAMVTDLNKNPNIFSQLSKYKREDLLQFDSATCTVSIDYLVNPVEVLSSLRDHMSKSGKVHLVISNRCFPTKAVKLWLELDIEERLHLVGGMLTCPPALPC